MFFILEMKSSVLELIANSYLLRCWLYNSGSCAHKRTLDCFYGSNITCRFLSIKVYLFFLYFFVFWLSRKKYIYTLKHTVTEHLKLFYPQKTFPIAQCRKLTLISRLGNEFSAKRLQSQHVSTKLCRTTTTTATTATTYQQRWNSKVDFVSNASSVSTSVDEQDDQ